MLCSLCKDVVVVVDIEVKISVMLFGQGDAFVIDEAAVLDRVDTGEDRVLDGLRAVSVGGDLSAQLVRFLGDGLEFLLSILRGAGLIPFGEHSAGSMNLDQIRAILDVFPHFLAHRPGSIRDALASVVELVRKKVIVAMSAGDAERRT